MYEKASEIAWSKWGKSNIVLVHQDVESQAVVIAWTLECESFDEIRSLRYYETWVSVMSGFRSCVRIRCCSIDTINQ